MHKILSSFLLGALLLVNGWVQAQSANPQVPLYSASRFVRVDFENDLLQLRKDDVRDGNFTNGVRLELMGNYWKRLPTRFLLLEFPNSKTGKRTDFDELYSFSFGQEMYTPSNIKTADIQRLDRPYAGWLYASSGLTTVDVIRSRKLTSSVSVGVMGRASAAAETQALVHRIVNSPRPEGWGNQVRDALGLSYAVRYESRPFKQIHRSFDLISLVEGHAGTVTNYAGGGFTLRVGQFNNYFQNAVGLYHPNAYMDKAKNALLYSQIKVRQDSMISKGKQPSTKIKAETSSNRKFQMYFFMRPLARIVLDNSFLQGGWFRRDNPYTIYSEDITHFYVNVEYGGVIAFQQLQLTYTQSFRTKEFQFGNQQQWGRISLLFGL